MDNAHSFLVGLLTVLLNHSIVLFADVKDVFDLAARDLIRKSLVGLIESRFQLSVLLLLQRILHLLEPFFETFFDLFFELVLLSHRVLF